MSIGDEGKAFIAKKDTVKYHVKVGKRVVDKGIIRLPAAILPTAESDWYRREALVRRQHPGACLKQIGRRTTWEAAMKWLNRGGKRRYRKVVQEVS